MEGHMSKLALQIVMGILGIMPVATGLLGLLGVEDPFLGQDGSAVHQGCSDQEEERTKVHRLRVPMLPSMSRSSCAFIRI